MATNIHELFQKMNLDLENDALPIPDYESDIRAVLTSAQRSSIEIAQEKAGVPERYGRCTLDNFHVGDDTTLKEASNRLRQFLETALATGGIAVIVGGTGTGKTHLAVGAVREMLAAGASSRYRTKRKLLDPFRRHKEDAACWQLLDDIKAADFVVVEDVDAPVAGVSVERDAAILQEIVCERYDDNKPTLLTMHYDRDEEKDIWKAVRRSLDMAFSGKIVLDRIMENGVFIPLDVDSYRLRSMRSSVSTTPP